MSEGAPIEVTTAEATSAHGSGLAALFARSETPCHCRFWHFEGTNNEWLERCANAPERNRDEMLAALEAHSVEMQGVVALDGDTLVGWMKLVPAASVRKVYEQRPYRALPIFGQDREGVLALGCMLVDPAWRHRGIAEKLIAFGIEWARARGARAIEAFPRRAAELRDEELLAGPFTTLVERGFEVVHDFPPYPVLRLKFA